MPHGNTLSAALLQQLELPSPVTQIHSPLLDEKRIQLFIKRDELIHPVIQGNKWRKLKYNLQHAIDTGHHSVLSFGGAWSNHLHALAAASQLCELNSIGIIRGEAPSPLNPCLTDMQNCGMQLEYISRKAYREKTNDNFLQQLKEKYGDIYIVPEGGNNAAGIQGCAELLDELEDTYDYICCESGSGTMLSSLISHNKNPGTCIMGFAVMKNPNLQEEIEAQLHKLPDTKSSWQLIHDYHFGGFAKNTTELIDFIQQFKQQHTIQLEPVYSAKMLFGIMDMISRDQFKTGAKILAIHGGGLQGLRGFSIPD